MCSRLQPHNPSQQGPLQQRRTNTNTNFVSPLPSLILTLFPSPPALSPSPDVSPSSSSSSSLSTSSSSRRVAPSLLHHSFALEHTIANINHWDPPNLHYLLPNHTRGTLPPPPSPPVAVSAHFPLPPKTLSAKSQTDTDTDTDHTDADTNTRPEGGWGGSKLGPRKPDAVCVTQTFRNEQSGPMLYMFVQHYHSLGWEVLIYDVSQCCDILLQNKFLLYCTVLYCAVLYCTVLYCTVLYCTSDYCAAVLCCPTELCCALLYHITLMHRVISEWTACAGIRFNSLWYHMLCTLLFFSVSGSIKSISRTFSPSLVYTITHTRPISSSIPTLTTNSLPRSRVMPFASIVKEAIGALGKELKNNYCKTMRRVIMIQIDGKHFC